MKQPAQLEIKRHYERLSEQETEQVVSAVAELIVSVLKRSGIGRPAADRQTDSSLDKPLASQR